MGEEDDPLDAFGYCQRSFEVSSGELDMDLLRLGEDLRRGIGVHGSSPNVA
jgi:hypothetical protein